MRSSMDISPTSSTISVLLASPNFSLSPVSSSTARLSMSFSLPSISFSFATVAISSRLSSSILSLSRAVSLWRRISRIAWAWRSESANVRTRPAFAAAGLSEPLMSSTISSRLSRAILKPSRMWRRSSALRSSYWVLRVITSFLCSTKWARSSFRLRTFGWFLTSASIMMPKDVYI